MMFDLDHFKQVNDQNGHATGDKVLIEFVRVVSASLRKSDLLGRVGGEEFVAIFPDTPIREARQIAERIRAAVERANPLGHGDESPKVTVSVGVTDTGRHKGVVLDQLLAIADSALYKAKSTGRNKVCVA